MTAKKESAIESIRDKVERMSELVLAQLRELEELLNSGRLQLDKEKESRFFLNERTLDEYEIKISEEFINILSLHKPVASELRLVVACYRLSINLERIGDMSLKVLRVLSDINHQPALIEFIDEITNMLVMASSMVEKSLISFFNNDIGNAVWTLRNDDVVDEVNNKMIKKIIKKNRGTVSDSKTMSNFINIKIIVSNIERIADQATNIAEASIYYLRGEDIRHTDITDIESR